jgi:ATP-dependent helicase YprA (DUF1998 family)
VTVRDQIIDFLRDPSRFGGGANDPNVWLTGLQFAKDSIAAHDDYMLRPAQTDAWIGLATARAGLVLGPPGTGKTHLLSWLIFGYARARAAEGLPCRVLVSAFTLNAIGNLLGATAARCREHWPAGPSVHFFGGAPSAGLDSHIQHRKRLDGTNVRLAFQDLEPDVVIVGASTWSLYRLLDSGSAPDAHGLTAGLFDLVCIDEASQLVLGHGLMAMGGLKVGGRLVVAGDERQLPPIRANREIKLGERQLGGSLYSFLKSGRAPEFALDETFRLNGPLAAFPERQFYPGRYRSAVETSQLVLEPNWAEGLSDLEQTVLDPKWPICILVHDGPPSANNNPFEARLTSNLAKKLAERFPNARDADGGWTPTLWTERLAIVSPHRAQNALIRENLPSDLRRHAFVETVDRIQGKERDAIILSYCVADAEFALAEGEFIFAPERLNVAVTRARTKLIVLISRRLLDAVPTDQEIMDKAELLREFVFSAALKGKAAVKGPEGQEVTIQVRVLGFGDEAVLEDLTIEPTIQMPDAPTTTPQLEAILAAVRAEALANKWGTAPLHKLKRRLARGDDLLADLRILHQLGHVSLMQRPSRNGPFWVAKPVDPQRRVFSADQESVRKRFEETILGARRSRFAPYYDNVRDRFVWMNPQGVDLLLPLLQPLEAEGLIQFGTHGENVTIDLVEEEIASIVEDEPKDLPELSDEDFRILNTLEDIEASRINFGVFEAWTSVASLAKEVNRPRDFVAGALGRLSAHGWIMLATDGRVRARMGELAREVRHVRQRFVPDDADRRPYLVRSLKLETRDRDKPSRDRNLASIFEQASANHPFAAAALAGLSAALAKEWGTDAQIAGFQERGLEIILASWRGEGNETVVIAADTGSGKTEAAGLPLIAAITADRLTGIDGVRAILAYPRIRLAANQAQRLSGYLAALAKEPGMPTLTLGLQVGAVPQLAAYLNGAIAEKAGWLAAGPDAYTFPFFGCPACSNDLLMQPGAGFEGLERLSCKSCDWHFDGWVGTKQGMIARPPNFFLPTTDSLHQWLHDPAYGALFGDDRRFAAPRAILADEIHLYSHIHGAQVGLALQRLATRAEQNSERNLPILAIGMSATLGDPSAAWGKLINRESVVVVGPQEGEKRPNPRGREYFYFIQPEVESRGHDIAGASTTIQSLMCLAHGMRRRTGKEGGYRSLVFLDSIDKVRRLQAAYQDAEETKRLASLRTTLLGDDVATGEPLTQCCGEAVGCDRFRDGECWWFAANDTSQQSARGRLKPGRPLKVADQPIFSGTSGRIEALIKGSDVVFTTSSLEVGYDDPDITMVYQHYAPQNLASFIQRKGRGGRGTDDRPITGVTLSIYSPRDSWWFRKPHEMIEPSNFDAPLNMNNHFVRRGQILAATLDAFARHQYQGGGVWQSDGQPTEAAFRAAEIFVSQIFGDEPWKEFDDCPSLADLWTKAIPRELGRPPSNFRQIREAITWIPNVLFETINLPQIAVCTDQDQPDQVPRREDITLVLTSAAPGNATRRYDSVAVHWRPPAQGLAPWLDARDYAGGLRFQPYPSEGELRAQLPKEARANLENLSPIMFRPRSVHLETLGRAHGVGWQSDWVITNDQPPAPTRHGNADLETRRVRHDSQGILRGFPIVKSNEQRAKQLPSEPLNRWIDRADYYVGDSLGGKETGLALARVFWGADAEVKLAGKDEEPAVFAQTFVDPTDNRPMLHGYHVQTEGVRLKVNRARLDAFVASEVERLASDEAERRWHAAQMLRFLVESQAQAMGVNGYEARRGAELIVSAAGDPASRKRLNGIIRFWDGPALIGLFEDVRAQFLSQHPLMSQRRVARVASALADPKFKPLFTEVIRSVGDPTQFANYLRSITLHSLAVRLKQSFTHIGHGDERQVLLHVKLPIQFPEASEDVITICEAGANGDGTTRAFVDRFEEAIGHWSDGFIAGCPNADEDAALRKLLELEHHHARWRGADPNDTAALNTISAEVGLISGQAPPASLLRILFGVEIVGAERFEIYDLARSINSMDQDLQRRFRRAPSAWELTSAVVEDATTNKSSIGGRLLAAFGGLDDAVHDDSLSPEGRLADQVYRISARLCVDGCQACVHQSSDLMSDTLVEASTSRNLLRRFVEG